MEKHSLEYADRPTGLAVTCQAEKSAIESACVCWSECILGDDDGEKQTRATVVANFKHGLLGEAAVTASERLWRRQEATA